ncbi:K(+)-transporting ATPase subunit C [Flavisolibacter tropicus]|uniref:Potassium-transporting ATPase KdpC subunit n=1 Tax=Flavisolibacter tropicus TaxID=1492898 RepID=A0A172TTK4_9BACT|nr:K(+)-transporting ATPase subunit C [Flavisolibacter tropicus]ANE50087.1 potassium-transporting ATPase subunit C [Flavisolibacter tropicus]
MKKYLLPSIKLTLVMLVLCCGIYFLLVASVGKLTPGNGGGEKLRVNEKVVGYANIGQKFTEDRYFWGRPSAVDYNATGSAGSNKGPSNTDYIKMVQDRIDTFLVHNPSVTKEQIPAEMVTASGSGLDPNISPASAYIQVKRVAKARGLQEDKIAALVDQHIKKNPIGPDVINVLKLNIALDELKNGTKF